MLSVPKTRERRRSSIRVKTISNAKVHETGYLFKKSGGSLFKQYYFVLTDESLTFYRKKNDSRAKGEIAMPTKIVPLVQYEKNNAFQVIPLRFDKYSYEFMESPTDSIIVYAENASDERRWCQKMKAITQKIMEPFIFPDAINDESNKKDKNMIDIALDFNATQQSMHNKLQNMLRSNYFGLNSHGKSAWRSSLSLRGLNSEETDINELNASLQFGEITQSIESASCFCMHNESNLMVVGGRDAANGELAIFNCVSAEDGDDAEFKFVKKWQINDGIVSMDWRQNILLVCSTEGRVFFYKLDIANDSTIYLVAHNERNPSEPVVYSHSALQNAMNRTLLSAPGSWMNSQRINECKISCMKSPDCFLTIENESFHLWSLDSRGNFERPVYSQKASTSPLFAIEWNCHHNHQFVVGGVSKNLKIIDTRELTANPSKSVPWKVKKAHQSSIRHISWNPFVEYWIATCSDDGTVKVWDTRYNSGVAARTLSQHNNVVNCVKWSRSHCELLISGSDDRSLKVWNLRSPQCAPHHLLYSHLFAHPVIGCGYSPKRPMQFFGLSGYGELQSIEMTNNFVKDFVPHRFTDDDNEKAKDIEVDIYMRDMKKAHAAIPHLANEKFNEGKFETAQDLLNLVSTVGFQSHLAKYHKQYNFDDMLNKLVPFYHPHCVQLSAPNQSDVSLCEQMKLRMFVRKVLAKKEWRKLLVMADKIFKHLMQMTSEQLMLKIILLLKQYSYLNAIKWCIRCNELYHSHNKHSHFLPIAVSMLFPTIYHFSDQTNSQKIDPSLLRNSAVVLDAKLRDYDFLKWHFDFLLSLHECLQSVPSPNVSMAASIIEIWQSAHAQKKAENENVHRSSSIIDQNNGYCVITQTEYRLFFNALLSEGRCDLFFIECTRLYHRNKGYEVAVIIMDMMENEGYAELTQYLEQQMNDRFDDLSNPKHKNLNVDQVRLKKCCDACVRIVNICENCPELPKCLKLNLPKYLKKFTIKIQDLLKLMDAKYKKQREVVKIMMQFGKDLIFEIKQIQENKINTEYFFRNEISHLLVMVDTFCNN